MRQFLLLTIFALWVHCEASAQTNVIGKKTQARYKRYPKKVFSPYEVKAKYYIVVPHSESTFSFIIKGEKTDKASPVFDFLAGNSKQAALDKQTLRLIHDIEELEPAIKDKLFFLANAIIRDAKTTKAYSH